MTASCPTRDASLSVLRCELTGRPDVTGNYLDVDNESSIELGASRGET